MANAKSRVKAPKSATTKRGRGNTKRSLTGTKNATVPPARRARENSVVMGRPNNLRPITANEKVQFLFQNGLVLKDCDKFSIKLPPRQCRSNTQNKSVPLKKGISNRKPRIITKNGRIAKKTNDNLKLIDNILKSELMIERERPLRNNIVKNAVQTVNNNEIGISDQNDKNNASAFIKSNGKKHLENKNNNKSNDSTTNNIAKPKRKRRRKSAYYKKNKGKNKTQNVSKTKQVTLSNGLVLTLSLFQCDYCKKMFSSKASLRRHIYAHLDLKPHACKKCTKKFRYKMHLQNHINRHHSQGKTPPEPYPCNICDKTFRLEENLSLHLATHVKNENSYKCIYCDKKFSYHLLLIQHEKQHLVTGRYQCTVCSLSYECRNRLSMHVKSHLKIKDYMCQYCGKEFLRLNSMRRHVQICHGGQRIQCPICKKKLKGHLTEHMRTHKQARPHECKQCGQRFTQSTQLNVHRRSHSGVRPYLCRICERPFTHSNALMLHIRRHTGEKPFPCAMCPLSFSQLPHMKAHMLNIHKKENPYKCPKCDQFFKLKNQVETHAKICNAGECEPTFEERIQATNFEEVEVENIMSLSRMRFLLALLLTMIATKDKLKLLGFNKRLVDDLLVESLEAMGHTPCRDESLSPFNLLKKNIQLLLNVTIPSDQMEKFKKERKTTEELLELLTDEKKKEE